MKARNQHNSGPRLPAPDPLAQARFFLKDTIRQRVDFSTTDQNRGVAPPPIEKPYPPEAKRIDLSAPGKWKGIAPVDVPTAIARRESRRRYAPAALTLDELAFLLWATQGIRRRLNPATALRTVPSAGPGMRSKPISLC